MTFDECQRRLTAIRRRQGTRYPIVRIDQGGSIYQGRLVRADSDPEHRQNPRSPYGVLVLEDPVQGRRSATVLQIAEIGNEGLRDD